MADSFQLQKLTVPANLLTNPAIAETVIGATNVSTGAADAGKVVLLDFQGDIFLGGYTGLAFMKNVFVLPRDYWDKALSTPYSGQLFPTGGNSGGPGQVFPF